MRVGAGMPGSGADTPGLGLVREPVSDAIEFFATLEAALGQAWPWFGTAGMTMLGKPQPGKCMDLRGACKPGHNR